MTNGHVVQPYQEGADGAFAVELLEKAVASVCVAELDGLPAAARTQRIRALAASPENRRGLVLERTLEVHLSNGKSYPAEVKFYSPPAYVVVGTTTDASGKPSKEHGRDVAILKVQDKELPVVRLARHSTDLHLGQALFVIGFPGVVASHELLSRATQYEPSITTGRVSGFKEDIGGQRVIQTDAAIIQGNSGGPVFDDRGQVIGAATFTSLQGEQVVQGFNFLIPVETIQEAARKAGVVPKGDSMFTRLWNHGVDLYIRDLHYRAYRNMSAADRIHPGFPDVERVREDCDIKHKEQGYLHREEVQWAVIGALLLGAIAGVWFGGRRVVFAGAASHPQHHPRGARSPGRALPALSTHPAWARTLVGGVGGGDSLARPAARPTICAQAARDHIPTSRYDTKKNDPARRRLEEEIVESVRPSARVAAATARSRFKRHGSYGSAP